MLIFAAAAMLSLAACSDEESSSSIDTGKEKASDTTKKSNNGFYEDEPGHYVSESFSNSCRMKNDDSATVTKRLAVDYDMYGKIAAYTETAEYDETVSLEELQNACKKAKEVKDVEVSCEDNIIVTTYTIDNIEIADIKATFNEKCQKRNRVTEEEPET